MAAPTEPTAPRRRTTTTSKSAPRRAAGPEGTRPRAAARPAAGNSAPPPPREPDADMQGAGAGWMAGLGGLLKGGVLGQISGIEGPARSLERLAQSAERATTMLQRLDGEIGFDRIKGAFDLLERLTSAAEQTRDSVIDLQRSVVRLEARLDDLEAPRTPAQDRPRRRRTAPPPA